MSTQVLSVLVLCGKRTSGGIEYAGMTVGAVADLLKFKLDVPDVFVSEVSTNSNDPWKEVNAKHVVQGGEVLRFR